MKSFSAVKVTERVFWVGAIDWAIRDFHGYETSRGTTYNAYLVMADKITLVDTVKRTFKDEMLARVASVVDPSKIDYIVSHHSEMDHSGSLPEVMEVAAPEKVLASTNGVKALRDHFQGGYGDDLLTEWEAFLLRNQVRGRGVGFLAGEDKYFPDFILWLKGSGRQHIAFIDPHGLLTAGNLPTNPKVQFHKGIKVYQQQLNDRSGRYDIRLHSFISSSQMRFDQLKQQAGFETREEFHRLGIYFHNDGIAPLLQAILEENQGVD